MANLNAWQKLTRVLPNKPFGDGADGALSSATIPTLTKDSCSGSATSTTLTTAGSTFANGDILLLHQTRGTGVGQWEIVQVASGGGSTSLTLSTALNYTYTDSGASQAQAVKINRYTNVTVQSGTWTIPNWDQNVGGVFPMAINGTLTITGTIAGVGGTSTQNSTGNASSNGGVGCGFDGGLSPFSAAGRQGEGSAAAGGTASTAANGNGGGGAGASDRNGGGGGHANAGSNGVDATGGSAVGSTDLITMIFGGGGGGCFDGTTASDRRAGGGGGGGIVLIMAKNISVAGGVTANGGNSGVNSVHFGGAGAGGSVLIVCESATLGTALITAVAGTVGVAGSVGRIAVHHSGTVTGTTNPTFTDVSDASLVEPSTANYSYAYFM